MSDNPISPAETTGRSPRSSPRGWLLDAGILLVLVALAIGLTIANHSNGGDRYVAIGDSYTAGMGIDPVSTEFAPHGCLQSANSYPYLIQDAQEFDEFESAACTGAVVPQLFKSQPLEVGGANPPQFNRLNGDESFITLSIGGNDVGFWQLVIDCFSNDDPNATPCIDKYGGTSQLLENRMQATGDLLSESIAAVKRRSPKATIYVIGYQQVAPADGKGCLETMRASAPDAAFFDRHIEATNAMMRRAARANDVRFVNPYAASVGHDACQSPDRRWIEPRVGSRLSNGAEVHPNAAGQRAVADQILDAMRRDGLKSSD